MTAGAEARHEAAEARWRAEADARSTRADQLSFARLAAFLVAAVAGASAVTGSTWLAFLAALAALAFVALVGVHARVLAARDDAEARAEVHARHLLRVRGAWHTLPATGADTLPPDHGYAGDIDLVGEGSLAQRLDVTHTTRGEARLIAWLAAPADDATVRARQEAVRELAGDLELREDLEAFAARGRRALARAQGRGAAPKLDPAPFLAFTERPAFLLGTPRAWLVQLLPWLKLGAAA
ncbi:MAG: hypothetical protein AAF447_09670, partial [Myxococcota bacterium]